MGQETEGLGKFQQIIEKDGEKFAVIDTGLTVKSFYSQGGPGWENKAEALVKYGVSDVEDLPEVPYYKLEKIAEEAE